MCPAPLAVPYGHPVATLGGVLLAVLSTLSVGVKAVLSSILLDKSTESGLIPVVVAWYDALFSGCILLVVCAFTGDIPRMWTYFHDANKPPDAVLVFCALGTVAFFYNFVALAFIQATSALAIMIAGNFKHVLLIIMPLVLYDHDPSHALGWTHVIGISIFFLSLAWCTAIDVYNVWTAEEKPAGSGAAPTESSPLNREEQGGKGKVVEDSTAWTVPCLPGAPPRTVTGDKAA